MKKYNITVNGTTYEVEVEEVSGGTTINAQTASKPIPEPKVREKLRVESPKEVPAPSAKSETISAPMPGAIVEVEVSVGDTVLEGDTLLILEAMKMDNEIMAPRDGKIAEVNVSKGQSVDTGDPLISLE